MNPRLLLVGGLLLASCATETAVPTTTPQSDTTVTTAASPPTTDSRQVIPGTTTTPFDPSVGAIPDEHLDALKADAATRAAVSVESVEVIRAQQVIWSSTSLDCPEPGQAYTQVLTSGYWVVLEAGGDEYDYRAEIEGEFRLCMSGAPPHDVLVDR